MRIDRIGEIGHLVAPDLAGALVDRARRLTAIASSLRSRLPEADVVQGGTSLLILGASEDDVRAASSIEVARGAASTLHHEIEVVYDGPDLAAVAEALGASELDVARLHAERTYTALVTGFLPGFAYLGEIDPTLVSPRLAVPRKQVAPGAVGIAGALTGVYPFASPGGWRWLGNAVAPRLFQPD